jgi:TonB family protein
MQAKTLFLTMNLLMTMLSAGALHAADEKTKPYDCPAPVLPIAAVRENLSGDVTLQYQGNAEGRFADIRILKSSGAKALDKAAVMALARCKLPVPAAGETPPPGTIDYKFGPQVRVVSASAPALVSGSCAASERFTTYVASTYNRVEAPGVAIRFGVDPAGDPTWAASYERDRMLADEAVKFIKSCRFTPGMLNGAAVTSSSDGFIRMKAAAQ